MKVKLQFNLPEEEAWHRMTLDGQAAHLVLWDLDQWLRGKVKYSPEFTDSAEALTAVRMELHRLLDEYRIRLED